MLKDDIMTYVVCCRIQLSSKVTFDRIVAISKKVAFASLENSWFANFTSHIWKEYAEEDYIPAHYQSIVFSINGIPFIDNGQDVFTTEFGDFEEYVEFYERFSHITSVFAEKIFSEPEVSRIFLFSSDDRYYPEKSIEIDLRELKDYLKAYFKSIEYIVSPIFIEIHR
jgi:hypothetical protein